MLSKGRPVEIHYTNVSVAAFIVLCGSMKGTESSGIFLHHITFGAAHNLKHSPVARHGTPFVSTCPTRAMAYEIKYPFSINGALRAMMPSRRYHPRMKRARVCEYADTDDDPLDRERGKQMKIK